MHRYSVPKMTCGHCAGTIDHAVKAVDPTAKVTLDLKTRQVTVQSTAGEEQIAEAIRSAGYETTVAAP